jgi:hypothetical protein
MRFVVDIVINCDADSREKVARLLNRIQESAEKEREDGLVFGSGARPYFTAVTTEDND